MPNCSLWMFAICVSKYARCFLGMTLADPLWDTAKSIQTAGTKYPLKLRNEHANANLCKKGVLWIWLQFSNIVSLFLEKATALLVYFSGAWLFNNKPHLSKSFRFQGVFADNFRSTFNLLRLRAPMNLNSTEMIRCQVHGSVNWRMLSVLRFWRRVSNSPV